MVEQIIFYTLAALIAVFSVLAVTSTRIIRSATFLLFVLLGTAALYLFLNFHFLFAVQVAVYAGGIMVLFIMAIFLTHKPGRKIEIRSMKRNMASLLLTLAGVIACGFIIVKNMTRAYTYIADKEIDMQSIGTALMGYEKYQYVLPFEVISVLLLACIIGAILIARREDGEENILEQTKNEE